MRDLIEPQIQGSLRFPFVLAFSFVTRPQITQMTPIFLTCPIAAVRVGGWRHHPGRISTHSCSLPVRVVLHQLDIAW